MRTLEPERTGVALQTVPAQLGSGWSRVLEAVEIALLDARLAMFEEGLAALPLAIGAADAADAVGPLLPQLLGLSALAATHPGHAHLCFSGLKCIQQLMQLLRARGVGKQVWHPSAQRTMRLAPALYLLRLRCDRLLRCAGGKHRVHAEPHARRRDRCRGCGVAHRTIPPLRRAILHLGALGHHACGAHALAL